MPLPRISAAPPAPGPWTGFTQSPVAPQSPLPTPRRRRPLRGLGIGFAALVIAAGIGFASSVPSANGAGAAWTSFLPWTVLLLVLLGAAAVIRRAWWGLSAVIVAVLVWSAVFVPQMLPA
jgi:vancomycin resistance protein VanJ